ncbi:unnamed protein product [Adineta ricciae]|uniref:DED domain-containing protein n=1 Tax=Adineta ricciae TaxID=249248 RepID=A0A815R1K8_ADIRI|nr:unnamed protein product [Adineta ricciae]
MAGSLNYRAVLITRIQDLLSDKDRERLCFLLGKDTPEMMPENCSISETSRVLESLLEKGIISNQDYDSVIQAFTNIHCYDAVKRVKVYRTNQACKTQRSVSLQEILLQDSAEATIAHTITICDPSESKMDTQPSSPFLHTIANHEMLTNTSISVKTKKQENITQSRCKNRAFKGPLNIRSQILVGVIVLGVMSLPFVIVLSKKYIERTLKLKQDQSQTVKEMDTNVVMWQ